MADKAGEDGFTLAQTVAAAVASTLSGSFSLSQYSLGHGSPNLSSEDIEKALAAFHVGSAWSEITTVAAICGAGSIALRAEYDNAQRLRNAAAHRLTTNIQPIDLVEFGNRAKTIAMAFDLLASHNARLLNLGNPAVLSGKIKPTSTMKIIFLDDTSRGFSQKTTGLRRASLVVKDYQTARTAAAQKMATTGNPVVQRNRKKTPESWMTIC
ncbi:hypothetical protein K1T35_46130 [Pseudonocardia sp. DSM 110487]|uniref:hypothetical protein n=1 Tax=Pseudonocardia sp. DSM 110487 TaxID=2865833 RepID=UPI001C6A3CE1|nr:hypothetical protein [Pseudonocardia sp. DSM 110487]QYN35596.1 hypothetical protein K1T35_46130 [Pseudonocardia sp. DSM 110487]